MDLVEGKIIAGHYKLIRQLGHGSFGNVWLAHNLLADIDVAIKFYGMLDQKGLEEFREEFKTAYALRHPNLLNINHFDIFENCPYLVMPYCERGDVGHLIGKMDEAEIWRFITDVSNGLSFLHAFRPAIIHQDIKPENILITSDGHYVITDFGISHKLRTQLSKHSRTENSYGTLAYMGPERFSQKPMVIIASDIWSFGATLYEIMEGKLLWEGVGGVAQLNQAKLPDIESNYSAELIRLVKACLAVNPWDRPVAAAIYNYAVAYRQHRPLPQLTPNETAPLIEPSVNPIIHPQNGQTNRFIDPASRYYNTNNVAGGITYPSKNDRIPPSNHPTTQSQWKRWLTIVAACMCAVAFLSCLFLYISSIREESLFISCETLQDFERFIEKYPNSFYAEKARKHIAEMTPVIVTESSSPEPEPPVRDQTKYNNVSPNKKKNIDINNNSDNNSSQAAVTPIDVQPPVVQPSVVSEDEIMFYGCFTVDDYIAYVNKFPKGKFRKEADLKIEQLTGRRERGQTGTYIKQTTPTEYDYPQRHHGYNQPITTTSRNLNFSISVNSGYGRGFGGGGPGNGGYRGGGPGGRGPGSGGYHGGGPGGRR